MALSRAHLAQENRTRFPWASMFPCLFFLVLISRDTGEVQLVLRCICTEQFAVGRWQHCTVCASVNRECRGAVGNAGEGLGGLLALHQAWNYVAFLFSPSAKIVGACSKTWDLSTTGF